jgi:peptide/nickel transport system substrate-binding protein
VRQRGIAARLLIALLALALVAGACSSDDGGDGAASDTSAVPVPTGGTLVLGLEQEPDCLDWIGSCAGNAYGFWAANVTTLPRVFSVERSGDAFAYEPTNLVAGEPTLTTSPKQVVTYELNPDATWSDGTAITSADFKYTWEQIAKGDDVYDQTGYTQIESVDDSDPAKVVVTFGTTFADWKSLFGGSYGVLPAHLLEGKDRAGEMANGYSWSGGPWKIESWQKGAELTLVPNDGYWGDKPKLDKVTFKFITDSAAEFQAFKANEVLGIYPQPTLEVIEQISDAAQGVRAQYSGETAGVEGLWFNSGKAPFNDANVRKAVGHALDRDAIAERLFGKLGIKKALQSFTPTIFGDFTDEQAFADYDLDQAEVDKLMKASGWAKGGDGIWAKAGQKASFAVMSPAGNKRRELTQQVMQAQLKTAGFDLTFDNRPGPDFGKARAQGDFDMLLVGFTLSSFYPSGCNVWCSSNIPTEANDFSGNNVFRVKDTDVDKHYRLAEESLDESAAADANRAGEQALAAGAYFLPIDPLPTILLTSTKVVGSVEDNPVMGPFWKLHTWGLQQ